MCHFSCSDTVRQLSFTWLFCLLAAGCGNFVCAEDGNVPPPEAYSVPETVAEARSRAYLLHELIHDTLHVVHRDFFDADESVSIPSHSFEDVFEGIERVYGVKIKWLAVDARAMNIDNKPKTEFDHRAVKALTQGNKHFDELENQTYRFAGRIHLASQCLKCHLSSRSNNNARSAGLILSMPVGRIDHVEPEASNNTPVDVK